MLTAGINHGSSLTHVWSALGLLSARLTSHPRANETFPAMALAVRDVEGWHCPTRVTAVVWPVCTRDGRLIDGERVSVTDRLLHASVFICHIHKYTVLLCSEMDCAEEIMQYRTKQNR